MRIPTLICSGTFCLSSAVHAKPMNACTGGAPGLDDLLGSVSSQPAAPSTSNLADLLGGDHAPVPSTSGTASGFDDLLSHSTPSTSPQIEPFTAFEKDGIRVVFRASKPAGQEAVTDISASYSNASGQAISEFSLQVSLGQASFTLQILHCCCHPYTQSLLRLHII